MAIVSIKALVEAGVHFGHRVSRWNPKMGPYIFGKRNLIHIINLKETIKGLIRSARFLARVATRGEDVLFVGTKRQARVSVEEAARRCGMPYVTERWLGGTLTNFRTITSRVRRLEELEELESSGRIQLYSKKMIASYQREMRKMRRNLEGIRNMKKLPGVLVIVDPHHEKIAVAEARKLGIPTVCLTDTDSDPDVVDILTPGNDDAIRSIQLYVRRMADAVLDGKKTAPKTAVKKTAPAAEEKKARTEKPPQEAERPRRGARRGPPRRGAPAKATQRLPGGKTVSVERSSPARRGGGRGRDARKRPGPREAKPAEVPEKVAAAEGEPGKPDEEAPTPEAPKVEAPKETTPAAAAPKPESPEPEAPGTQAPGGESPSAPAAQAEGDKSDG
ncbi:MAG TPA: 30S ribosomal protein S2 [Planctomycetota bacterium]|nr:30S ribosomal protein S2 [Planctomycetota bacterium]